MGPTHESGGSEAADSFASVKPRQWIRVRRTDSVPRLCRTRGNSASAIPRAAASRSQSRIIEIPRVEEVVHRPLPAQWASVAYVPRGASPRAEANGPCRVRRRTPMHVCHAAGFARAPRRAADRRRHSNSKQNNKIFPPAVEFSRMANSSQFGCAYEGGGRELTPTTFLPSPPTPLPASLGPIRRRTKRGRPSMLWLALFLSASGRIGEGSVLHEARPPFPFAESNTLMQRSRTSLAGHSTIVDAKRERMLKRTRNRIRRPPDWPRIGEGCNPPPARLRRRRKAQGPFAHGAAVARHRLLTIASAAPAQCRHQAASDPASRRDGRGPMLPESHGSQAPGSCTPAAAAPRAFWRMCNSKSDGAGGTVAPLEDVRSASGQ